MPRKKSRTLTDVELEFMEIIWTLGEATPDNVSTALIEKGRSVSIGSIRNVLSIMIRKGYLTRSKKGKAFFYSAKIPKNQARRAIIQDILVTAFEGSESQVVAALLDSSKSKKKELKKIRRLLKEHKSGEKK